MTRGPFPIGALALILAVGSACGSGDGESATVPRSLVGANVLLIVVDTLGASHVGSYGRADGPTPNLDRLAAQGVRFEHAFSTAPWTQPSVASLFTSRMPSTHGVRNLLDALPAEALTLAEQLGQAGYRTHGVISHMLINAELGFRQGFDSYDESGIVGHDGISSETVSDRALEILDGVGDEPFFLFLHYFDPHFLYNHHAAFDRTAGYDGELQPAMKIWALRDRSDELTRADLDFLVGLYHEEIAFTDHQIGRVLDRLTELGLDESTLVVFTADHGEEFMEHGWIGHTRGLWDGMIRVPLVVRLPTSAPSSARASGRVEPAPVSALDVAPTILELVAPHVVDAEAQGISLASVLLGGRRKGEHLVFSEVSFDPKVGNPGRVAQKRAHKTAVVRRDLKLIHDLESDAWELYDRARDPVEQENLWGRDPERDEALRAVLLEWEARRPEREAAGAAAPAPDELENLRALGYVH